MTNYPLEIFISQKKQTFYVNSHLVKVTEDDAPLLTYSRPESLSRYETVIINENNKATTANIPVNEVMRLQRFSDVVYKMHVERTLSPETTFIIPQGKLKGKSPEEILLNDPDGTNKLRDHYKWLKENQEKYPKNAEQMAYIQKAVEDYKDGRLRNKNTVNSVVLYETNMRPLKSKSVPQNLPQGYQFVYEIKIEWILGNNVNVEIQNYYAPVETLSDGRLNVKKSALDKSTYTKNSFALTAEEWMNFMYNTQMDMRRFEMINAKATYDMSQQILEEKRKA